jgi:hypothetical protein
MLVVGKLRRPVPATCPAAALLPTGPHLTQRRERPSPLHAGARRKLGLKVGQSLLTVGYLRLNQHKP